MMIILPILTSILSHYDIFSSLDTTDSYTEYITFLFFSKLNGLFLQILSISKILFHMWHF